MSQQVTHVNKIVTKGVMYGFVRLQITESPSKEQYSWHAWSIYIQSSQNHEMSDYVDHVTFCLHKDLSDNIRTIFSPPYETTVFGALDSWAYAYIFFKDSTIPPQFFQIHVDFANGVYGKQVKYDNLIFVRPNIMFYKKLQIVRPCQKHSGLLHHIQPDLFKQLNPSAKLVEYKPNLTLEQLNKTMEECEKQDGSDGVGCYLIDAIKQERNAEKIIEQIGK